MAADGPALALTESTPFPGAPRGEAPQVTPDSAQFVVCAEHGKAEIGADYDGPAAWLVCDGWHTPADHDYLARCI